MANISGSVKELMITKNRLMNANNGFQGDSKRVLFVCTAGVLRSPTAAHYIFKD